MTHLIAGRSVTHRPSTGGGSGWLSARLTVMAGTQEMDNLLTIHWDAVGAADTWDNIGIISDYETSGNIAFPTAGDYYITAYARLSPVGAIGTGVALIVILLGFVGVNEEMTAPLVEAGPKLYASGLHHFDPDTMPNFEIGLEIQDAGDADHYIVDEASLSIIKIN